MWMLHVIVWRNTLHGTFQWRLSIRISECIHSKQSRLESAQWPERLPGFQKDRSAPRSAILIFFNNINWINILSLLLFNCLIARRCAISSELRHRIELRWPRMRRTCLRRSSLCSAGSRRGDHCSHRKNVVDQSTRTNRIHWLLSPCDFLFACAPARRFPAIVYKRRDPRASRPVIAAQSMCRPSGVSFGDCVTSDCYRPWGRLSVSFGHRLLFDRHFWSPLLIATSDRQFHRRLLRVCDTLCVHSIASDQQHSQQIVCSSRKRWILGANFGVTRVLLECVF